MKYKLNETIATGKFKQVLAENYTKNFELLCQSIKLNKVQQKILDQFINHGTIKNQYVGRVAGVKKEKKFFAAKKQYKGSIDNRNEALMKALKVNTHQQKILDSYLKTGKVIGKYAGSIAGSTKTTKSYSAFRGFKEHFESLPEAWELRERVGKMRSWKQGWDPSEEDQLRKDKKLKKDLEKYMKKDPSRNWSIKQAAKEVPYLLKHINTNFGDGKGQDLSDKKPHQFHNAILSFYDYEYLYESVKEARSGKSMNRKEIMRKHGNEFKKALRTGNLELSDKAEGDLIQYVMDNHPEEIKTDDPDDWSEWLDNNLEDFVKGRGY